MEEIGILGLLLILINVVVSYQGIKTHSFLEKYSFQVDELLIKKDYKRLVTSGFLHVGWMHLFFNMMTLYFFSTDLENSFGELKFVAIYFGSLLGGNLFSLFIHRNHGDYSAVGASGAVSGIVFASIALFPGMELGFFGLPFYIPGWAYGLLYVLYSIYGIKSQRDNIGHEAHLGGGLVGLLLAIAMVPSALLNNYIPILLILIPSMIFIYMILTKPEFLMVDNLFQKSRTFHDVDEKYHSKKILKERELNKLLEKISVKGINSLTSKEKEKLNQYSNER